MSLLFKQLEDKLLSCKILEAKQESTYNTSTNSYTYTPYYQNNSTLKSINSNDHTNAVAYFKNITSALQEHCGSNSMYILKFNSTEALNEIASNLTNIYDYYNSNLCTQMFRRSGIEMMDYACNDKEIEIDNFFTEFTNTAKTTFLGETIGSTTDNCEA